MRLKQTQRTFDPMWVAIAVADIVMTILFVCVLSSTILGCSTAPVKPKPRICHIDFPAGDVVCGETDGGEVHRIPLFKMDKATAISPPDWASIKNYIHALEQRSCE